MKRFIILGVFIISLVFPRRDCLKQAETFALGRSTRPEKDTFAISDSGYFYIWYDTLGSDAPDLIDLDSNNIPDYIDEVSIIADSAYHVLVDLMGFSAPPADEDGFYDIYLESYAEGVYGYNTPDSPSHNSSGATSYLQIDNNYSGFNSIFNLTPIQIMQITVGHEYFHAIQWGYESTTGKNKYFYEMSSMWFEDVLIPEGNDYLDGWADPLLNNPTVEFDNTGEGYELALFGHYLSSFIDLDGIDDEKNSSIMRKIWERYGYCNTVGYISGNCDAKSAFSAIQYILQNNYNTIFIEAWVDFISRNLYNGKDERFYYYSDQALIEPISTYPQTLEDRDTCVLSLDNKSAAIQSYQLSESGLLSFDHLSADYLGRFSIVSTRNYNDLFWGSDTSGVELTSNSDIHFVYGSETQESATIDIIYNSSCGLVEGGTVWPGDTNADNLVNIDDILPIGVYWSQNLPEAQICKRSLVEDSLYQWSGQPLLNNMFLDDNCISHADANGDGAIDIADILPIMINWGYETSDSGDSNSDEESCIVSTPILSRYYSNFSQVYNSLTGNSNAEIQIRSRLEELFGFSSVPNHYKIYQSYPNPFNPIASIPYLLPQESIVKLSIYNIMGQEVFTEGSFVSTAGYHEIEIDGTDLSSGVYFYQFIIDGHEFKPMKMVLIK